MAENSSGKLSLDILSGQNNAEVWGSDIPLGQNNSGVIGSDITSGQNNSGETIQGEQVWIKTIQGDLRLKTVKTE